MKETLVSHDVYMTTAMVATAGVAGWWVIVDALRLRRSLREQPRTAWVRDRIFGSIVGIATGVVGVGGIVLYHLR